MSEKLSILHVDTEPAWRGGQEALVSLATELAKLGHRQRIACPRMSPLARVAAEAGIEVVPLGASRELRRAILHERPQILHAHTGRAQNLAFLAGLGLSVQRVVTRHVAFPPRYPAIHRWKYTRTCDRIIAVSDAVKTVLVDNGVPAKKITVIRTGIRIPQTIADRVQARHRFQLDPAAFVVGQLGAFTREKGQDIALAAWKEAGLDNAQLILAGDGPLRDPLMADAPPSVLFPGFVDERWAFYAMLDILIMPSRSEAWGLAALEAMASGVPVIASRVGGLPEMLGDTGHLVPPGDIAALAQALRQASKEETRVKGAQARERAKQFSIETTARETEAVYRSLCPPRP